MADLSEQVTSLNDQVKRKLRVTWDDDEATEERIKEIIANAEQDMRNLLGIPDESNFDFSAAGMENSLFLNRCWYEWEGALDDFEKNYAMQLGRCRDMWMVKQYVEEQKAANV